MKPTLWCRTIPSSVTDLYDAHPNYGTLKVCKVAGFGVAVGTPITFNYKTKSGSGTVTVPAGPAPGGYCVVVGTFSPGAYAISEVIPEGDTVTSITAVPSGGKAKLATGTFTGKITAQAVTEVTYTDQDVPAGRKTGYLEICKDVPPGPAGARLRSPSRWTGKVSPCPPTPAPRPSRSWPGRLP